MSYNEIIWERFQNPHNAGLLTGAEAVGQITDIHCGEVVKLYLRVTNNQIVDAKFKACAGVAVMAVADIACDLLKGLLVAQIADLTPAVLLEQVQTLPENKVYVLTLLQEVMAAALQDYAKKNGKK